MSSTRMLVLGVVRILQPVHGYDVRRELLSWGAETWANVAPGSVYSALKTLERDQQIEVVSTDQRGTRPARTVYRLTPEGEKTFGSLLRDAWWRVEAPVDPLSPAITFMPYMDPGELAAALRSRVTQIGAQLEQNRYALTHVGGDPGQGGTPDHVAELWRLFSARLEGEAAWADDLAERLEAGAYADAFAQTKIETARDDP